MYDLIVRNALVVDGTGKPGYKADVAVYGSIIADIGKDLEFSARNEIEGEGLVLAPGFIDFHSHEDLEVLRHPMVSEKLKQGFTTTVNGNCGVGLFPLEGNKETLDALSRDVLGEYTDYWDWKDFSTFSEKVNKKGAGLNQIYLIAHTPLRVAAMGEDCTREATDEEIDRMVELLDENLSEGALGFSSGLYYSPCIYASQKELDAILSCVAKHNKIFAVHHRCEGDDFLTSLKEVLDLSKRNGCRLEISHLKAIGKRNQNKVPEGLRLIEKYRAEGVDVEFDQYPYEFGSTSLFSFLPPDVLQLSKIEQRLALGLESERERIKKDIMNPDGWDSLYSLVGADRIRLITLDSFPEYQGKLLSDVGEMRGEDPLDSLLYILSEETGKAVMTDVTQDEDMLEMIMQHPLMHFGTDSLFSSDTPHPRTVDATMHFMRKYVSERHVLELEDAVRRMTGFTADRIGLKDRGYIEPGKIADLVLFNPVKGEVKSVIVNGRETVENNVVLGYLEGKVLQIR